jgi:hypothetical protein
MPKTIGSNGKNAAQRWRSLCVVHLAMPEGLFAQRHPRAIPRSIPASMAVFPVAIALWIPASMVVHLDSHRTQQIHGIARTVA